MQYTISDFQNTEAMQYIHETFHHLFLGAYRKDENFSIISKCDQQSGDFWNRFFSIIAYLQEEEIGTKDIEPNDVTKFFSYDLIKLAYASSGLSEGDAQYYFEKEYPYLEFLQAVRITASQWYSQKLPPREAVKIFERIVDLPKPFGDEKFRCVPIHTHTYKKGWNYSPWLEKETGNVNSSTRERFSSPFRNIYLDGKIGILIFYKNKPNFTISFNIDANKNIYIHQIQSHLKARALYLLGENWQEKALDYICSIFPDYTANIIDGKYLSDSVKNSYSNDADKDDLPSNEMLSKIKLSYNNLRTEYQKTCFVGDVKYRKL
jgi:hypothetical protein